MANNFLTPNAIAKEALSIFKNQMNMSAFVDRQLSTDFADKKGDSIRVRRLTRYEAVDGPDITGSTRSIIEGSDTVTIDSNPVVGVEITSKEMSLDLVDFKEQVLNQAIVELTQKVESSLTGLYKQVWNQVGTPGTTPSTISDGLQPARLLDQLAVPRDMRSSFYEPVAAYNMAASLGAVFPDSIARRAIEEGEINRYGGINYMMNQSIQNHTVGAYAGTPLINGVGQNVTYDSVKDTYEQTLVTDGWTATTSQLKEGDRFTIDNVFSVNARTRQSTGSLQQFVVRADATADGSGNKTLTVSPPIIASGAFQTVDSVPADGASITVLGTASVQYPQNIAMQKNAFTLAFARLGMPMGGAKGAVVTDSGMSMRVVMDWNQNLGNDLMRIEMLYGVKAQNPGMAVVHVG